MTTALHRLMAPNPQIWTVSAILDHGFGAVVRDDGMRACLGVTAFRMVEGPYEAAFAQDIIDGADGAVIVTSSNSDWYEALARRPDLACTELERKLYVWDESAAAQLSAALPAPFDLRPIGAAEARQIMATDWADDVFDSYRDVDDFLARGFGCCVVTDNKIVSLCTSFATSNYGVEIEVDTDPDWQGRGLAQRVSAHFIAESLRRGLPPLWDASNSASAKVAEALGFRRQGIYRSLQIARAT